jgi:hypothetical protein
MVPPMDESHRGQIHLLLNEKPSSKHIIGTEVDRKKAQYIFEDLFIGFYCPNWRLPLGLNV